MKEKKRYIIDRFDGDIFDTKKGYYPSNQTICEIINQQDKRIKELEEQEKFNFDYRDRCRLEEYQRWADNEITKLNKENQQLKYQLSELNKENQQLKQNF